MIHRERKIFSGDLAWVGVLLLVALWLLSFLPTLPLPLALAEVTSATVNYRGR